MPKTIIVILDAKNESAMYQQSQKMVKVGRGVVIIAKSQRCSPDSTKCNTQLHVVSKAALV